MRRVLNVPVLRYAAAVGCVALALGFRMLLTPEIGSRHPFSLLYLGLLASVALCGLGPAILAGVVGGVASNYVLLSLPGVDPNTRLASLAIYVVTSGILVALVHSVKVARGRVETQAAEFVGVRDGLEQRVAERTEALRASNERLLFNERVLAGMFDSAMDALVLIDDRQTVFRFNHEAERLFGHRAADVLGTSFESLLPERDRPGHADFMARYEHPESPTWHGGHDGTLSVIRADGTEMPIEASMTRTVIAGKPYYSVVLRSIAERLTSARALADSTRALSASTAKLEAAVAASGLTTFEVDLVAQRVFWDDAALEMWGRTREEVGEGTFRTIAGFVLPEDRRRLFGDWQEGIRAETAGQLEYRIRRRDGSIRWLRTSGAVERDADGNRVRYQGVTADITERKRAEEERFRSQKLEALGTLAGGIAHDFNNVLLAISGNADLGRNQLDPEHPAAAHLAEIQRAAARASDVVRRILTFSRPGDGERRVVALTPIVHEALQLMRATLPMNLQITEAFAADVPSVEADAAEIHRVVVNLATNAAHAITGAGRIVVALDRVLVTPEMVAGMSGLEPGVHACLSVSDTGCGMDRATVARVFDPFFTTRPAGAGTGLGLSVVHGIMKRHGGAITVASEEAKGTTFSLYFPASTAVVTQAAAAAPSGVATGSAAGAGERVLYVDDEPAIVNVAVRLLDRRGYRVTGCSDPLEAFTVFTRCPGAFDVLVTDLAMPNMPGLDLVAAIREIRPELPVILTSGLIRPEDERRAEQLHVTATLVKPDTREGLLRVLGELFAARRVSGSGSTPAVSAASEAS